MGLFSRTPAVRVVVTPETVDRRQAVTATVTTDKPIDKVSAARWTGATPTSTATAGPGAWTRWPPR